MSLGNVVFFAEEEIYWEPSVDRSALYQQLSLKRYREIIHQQIEYEMMLYALIEITYIIKNII